MHEFIPVIKICPKQCPALCIAELKIIIPSTIYPTWKHLKTSLQSSINQAQVTFRENLVRDHANGNSGNIFKHIKNITKSSTIPASVFLDSVSASLDEDKANLLNFYFHSVLNFSTDKIDIH